MSLKLKSAVLSCFLMLSLLMVWQIATMPKPKTGMNSEQTEYAKLMGKIPY